MDGIHDMGGMQGFGPVRRDDGEPVFHAPWQGRVFGLVQTALPNADAFRHAIERMRPVEYLGHGYYGRWLACVETLALEHGLVDREEYLRRLRALGCPRGPVETTPPEPAWGDEPPPNTPHAGLRREVEAPPLFAVGQRVRARDTHERGHHRLPRYARGRRGVIESWHRGWVFPDTHAHGHGANPQHLYTVSFDAREIWGEEAAPGDELLLELFESYLEADTGG